MYQFDNTVTYLPKFTRVTSHTHDLNKPTFESKKSVQTCWKSGQKLGFKQVLNKFDVMQFMQYTVQLRPVRSRTLIRHLYTVVGVSNKVYRCLKITLLAVHHCTYTPTKIHSPYCLFRFKQWRVSNCQWDSSKCWEVKDNQLFTQLLITDALTSTLLMRPINGSC